MTGRTPQPIKVVETLIDGENELADFIANGPSGGLPGYVRDAYRDRCDQFANLPGWAQLLTRGPAGAMNRVCEPWWDSQGTDGPISAPPFEGGQCPGTRYSLSFSGTVTSASQCQNEQDPGFQSSVSGAFGCSSPIAGNQIWGPIAGVFSVSNAQSGSTGFNNIVIRARTQAGAANDFVIATNHCPAKGGFNVALSNITPCSGTDDCGNPEDELQPGPNPPANPGPTPGPEPTDDPQNPTGPPLLPIPPYDDPIGGPVPIDAPSEPEPFDPTAIPPTGGDGLPGNPDAIGEPAGEVEGGDDGLEVMFGDPPPGRIWVGCCVVAMVDPRLGNIPGTGPLNTVYPRTVGNVSLKFGSFFGTMQRINSRFTLLFRENSTLIVTGCFLQAQPGATLVVRPISTLTCPESPCEE